MTLRLQCASGHTWEMPRNGCAAHPDATADCPVCRRPAESLSLEGEITPGALPRSDRAEAPTTDRESSPDTPPQEQLPPNLTVQGYELLRELGRGGMGVVYLARQQSLKRLVALKMVLAGPHARPTELARLRTEAEAVARLQHPNIIQVYDVGERDGLPFVAMEYVGGGTLSQRVGDSPLPSRPAARLVEGMARAVQAAHDAGIVHRDLKPANVLLTGDGAPKITDFGLAKLQDDDSARTATGAVLGTPSYMAPEQAAAEQKPTKAVDVYALGAILYKLLTGRPPFQAPTVLATLEHVRTLDVAPPRQLQPAVPRDLETICLKCLRKSPGERYGSAAELADDLKRFLAGEPIQARRRPLRERAVRWARRRPGMLVGLLLAAALGAGAYQYWRANYKVEVEYYANMVKRHGVAEGVGRVAAGDLAGRGLLLRFYKRGGVVEAMEAVNGDGELTPQNGIEDIIAAPTDEDERPRTACRFEYRRDAAGRLTEQVAFDRFNRVVWTFHYTTPTTGVYTDARGFPSPRTGSGAAYVEFTWTDEGFERAVRFLDRDGVPKPNAEGVYGYRQQLDLRGLVSERTLIGRDDQPIVAKDLFATWRSRFDDRGNEVERAYYGVDGQPCLHKEGYHRVTCWFNDRDNWAEVTLFDTRGRPCLHQEGFHRWVAKHDAHGHEVERRYYDTDGRPCLHSDGTHLWVRKYDARGNVAESSFFGTDGKPCLYSDGTHRWVRTYDDRGYPKETAFFGTDGRPCYHKDGYAKWESKSDDQGRKVEALFFDADGRPCVRRDSLLHKWQAQFDDRGNHVANLFFGPDGKPCYHKDGAVRWTARFDGQGNEMERSFFGPDGKPCLLEEGFARWVTKYDDAGRSVERSFYGVNGEPCLHKDGNHRWTREYDRLGYQVAAAFFGTDGKPCLLKDGYHRWSARCDGRGNELERTYFGTDNKPCLTKEGFARAVYAYDERGREVDRAYFGVDGKPCLHAEGNHRWAREYDRRGNQTRATFLGLDGRPCMLKFGFAGWAGKYDERGNEIERTFFGPDGQLCLTGNRVAGWTSRFDERHNEIERSYFGADGKPCRHSDGNGGYVSHFDERGNEVQRTFVGLDGKPCLVIANDYSRWTAKYDEYGRNTETALFDTEGKPCTHPDGHHRWVARFDERGHEVGRTYYDTAGRELKTIPYIATVEPGRKAVELGLKAGDVILSYAGKAMTQYADFTTLRGAEPTDGAPKELVVRRGGEEVKVLIPPGMLGITLKNRLVPK
jgi:predicted Ser/Thr protein kinase